MFIFREHIDSFWEGWCSLVLLDLLKVHTTFGAAEISVMSLVYIAVDIGIRKMFFLISAKFSVMHLYHWCHKLQYDSQNDLETEDTLSDTVQIAQKSWQWSDISLLQTLTNLLLQCSAFIVTSFSLTAAMIDAQLVYLRPLGPRGPHATAPNPLCPLVLFDAHWVFGINGTGQCGKPEAP